MRRGRGTYCGGHDDLGSSETRTPWPRGCRRRSSSTLADPGGRGRGPYLSQSRVPGRLGGGSRSVPGDDPDPAHTGGKGGTGTEPGTHRRNGRHWHRDWVTVLAHQSADYDRSVSHVPESAAVVQTRTSGGRVEGRVAHERGLGCRENTSTAHVEVPTPEEVVGPLLAPLGEGAGRSTHTRHGDPSGTLVPDPLRKTDSQGTPDSNVGTRPPSRDRT